MPIAYCVWKMENSSCSPARVSLRKTAFFFSLFLVFFFPLCSAGDQSATHLARGIDQFAHIVASVVAQIVQVRVLDRRIVLQRKVVLDESHRNRRLACSSKRRSARRDTRQRRFAPTARKPMMAKRRFSVAPPLLLLLLRDISSFEKKKTSQRFFGFLLSPDSQAVFTTRRATPSSCG